MFESRDDNPSSPAHFEGQDAIGHVAETQVKGIIFSSEAHGTEIPGHVSAAADAAREIALVLLLIWTASAHFALPFSTTWPMLAACAVGLAIWKCGRSARLGWDRLERLHRILEQEKWEIEHHRQQEREELRVLYSAKGFEGKLLEDVLDVLMADGDRLLRVMIEEELGLSLESHEHPLKQGLGALLGGCAAAIVCLICFWILPSFGLAAGAFLVFALAGAALAHHAQNRLIPAVIWNLGIGIFPFGAVYFLLDYFKQQG